MTSSDAASSSSRTCDSDRPIAIGYLQVCSSDVLPGETEDGRRFRATCDGTTCSFGECGCFLDQLDVRRLAVATVELEPEVEMTAALERELRDVGATEVTADDRRRPRDRRVAEQVEVRVEAGRSRRQPERRAAQAPLGRQVELHHRAARQLALALVEQGHVEEPRLVDRQARTESELVVV